LMTRCLCSLAPSNGVCSAGCPDGGSERSVRDTGPAQPLCVRLSEQIRKERKGVNEAGNRNHPHIDKGMRKMMIM